MNLELLDSRLGRNPECEEGTGPISLLDRVHLATKDRPQTLKAIVANLREMSEWTIQLPPQFGLHEVEGTWDGTFQEVLKGIAEAGQLRALLDEPSKTATFVPVE